MSIGMVGGLDQKGLLNQPYTDFPTINEYVLKTAQPQPMNFLVDGVRPGTVIRLSSLVIMGLPALLTGAASDTL